MYVHVCVCVLCYTPPSIWHTPPFDAGVITCLPFALALSLGPGCPTPHRPLHSYTAQSRETPPPPPQPPPSPASGSRRRDRKREKKIPENLIKAQINFASNPRGCFFFPSVAAALLLRLLLHRLLLLRFQLSCS